MAELAEEVSCTPTVTTSITGNIGSSISRRSPKLRYSLHSLFLVTGLAAVLCVVCLFPANFVLAVSVAGIFVVQAAMVFFAIELLTRRMPPVLTDISKANEYRLDDSWSPARARLEFRARTKFRADMLAAFLIVALTGNLLAFAINSFVIPIEVGMTALSSLRLNWAETKSNLQDAGVDRSYSGWQRRQFRVGLGKPMNGQRFCLPPVHWCCWPVWPG